LGRKSNNEERRDVVDEKAAEGRVEGLVAGEEVRVREEALAGYLLVYSGLGSRDVSDTFAGRLEE